MSDVTATNRSGFETPTGALGIDCNGDAIYEGDEVIGLGMPGAFSKVKLEGVPAKAVESTASWMILTEATDGSGEQMVRIDCELRAA